MKIKLKCYTHKVFADQMTPVNLYLTVRNLFTESILLESSEVNDKSNASSIICVKPIAGIQLNNGFLKKYFLNKFSFKAIEEIERVQDEIKSFIQDIEIEDLPEGINGLFGYQTFESVRYFETKKADLCSNSNPDLPVFDYRIYQYIICINHFNNEIQFIENVPEGQASTLSTFISKISNAKHFNFPFKLMDHEESDCSEEEYIEMVKRAQFHCGRGDVFQLVVSRLFKRKYKGDEFNVYRSLRHINPSPYMFYFDYGNFKIFGSSPEAQLRIADSNVIINPIAGTYKRTGNKKDDAELAEKLLSDKKELAEHAMLVDLGRNDMNRHCEDVHVAEYKVIQKYSHVIHMVSTIKGRLRNNMEGIEVLADTFPAGTLSGAPKVKAIKLLTEIEKSPRGFYGGSIGFIDFKGDINQAIIIRSFFAKGNEIHFRAGAGVVLKSDPLSELKEVENKLSALRMALTQAEKIN